MVTALLPEIILIPSIIALIILVVVTSRKCTRKRKEIYLENFMPPIVDMLVKLGLKEAMLRDFEYRSNTFNKVLLQYVEERKKNDLLKLANNLRITDDLCTNKFGLALGSLLVEILANSTTFVEKSDKSYAWYYLEDHLEENVKGKPILEYFFIWIRTKTFAMYTKGPYMSMYAFDAYFDVKLEVMVRGIWIKTNNFGIVEKSFGHDGVRFSKYLVIFFTYEVNGYDFRSFLKNEKKAFGSEFELVYVGANDPETLKCYILDKENDFLAKEEYFLYSFIVLKNLNYKPYFEPKEEVKDSSQLKAPTDEKSVIKEEKKDGKNEEKKDEKNEEKKDEKNEEKKDEKNEEKIEEKDGKPIAVEANEPVEINEEVKKEIINELNIEEKK